MTQKYKNNEDGIKGADLRHAKFGAKLYHYADSHKLGLSVKKVTE